MPHIQVSDSAAIPAAPAALYALLADYREGHPRVLPEKYFAGLEVLAGGVGAGTRIRVGVRILGTVQQLLLEVSEPEPGRVLAETDPRTGAVTTFTVDPEGSGSRLTIAVAWDAPGLSGWVQSRVMPGYLRGLYAAELERIARVMAG